MNDISRMKKPITYLLILSVGLVLGYCCAPIAHQAISPETTNEITQNPKEIQDELRYLESSLDSMHQIKPNPIPGEWLFHNKELQQYPHQFLAEHPNILEEERQMVYIQPIGTLSEKQGEIMEITRDYIEVFYNVNCEILDSLSADLVPDENRRTLSFLDGQFEKEQLQTTYIKNEILKPRLPDDARAYMGFTAFDLYPNENYNFVFGQGSLGGHVGIYSINRLGIPEWDSTEFKTCLLRTMKLATHELGHIFGFRHCVDYKCVMNGSNSLEESDGKPYYFCPYEVLKVSYALSIDQIFRFEKLAAFWGEIGFPEHQLFYETSADLLRDNFNRVGGRY